MKPIAKQVGFGLLVAAIVVLVYPVRQTVAPEWQITVVDEKGNRLSGIHVRETWQQQSLQQRAQEEVKETDATGSVHFSRRVVTASLLQRMWGCWSEMRRRDTQSTCGPSASVWAFGPGLGTMDQDDIRDVKARYRKREIAPELTILPDAIVEEQSSTILLHHCPPSHFGPGCSMAEAK